MSEISVNNNEVDKENAVLLNESYQIIVKAFLNGKEIKYRPLDEENRIAIEAGRGGRIIVIPD